MPPHCSQPNLCAVSTTPHYKGSSAPSRSIRLTADVARCWRGVGRGRTRVGGVAAGSPRRVCGCRGWRFRGAGAGSRRRHLDLAVAFRHGQHGHSFQPEHRRGITALNQPGAFPFVALTPRIMRPQAQSPGSGRQPRHRPLPRFIEKTRISGGKVWVAPLMTMVAPRSGRSCLTTSAIQPRCRSRRPARVSSATSPKRCRPEILGGRVDHAYTRRARRRGCNRQTRGTRSDHAAARGRGLGLMGIEHRRASIRSLRRCFRPTSLLRRCLLRRCLLRRCLLRDPCRGFRLLHGSDCDDAEHLVEAGGL